VKFGVGLPTRTARTMYPVPFAPKDDIVRGAIGSEELGCRVLTRSARELRVIS
jgi:hypothetical protein